MSEPNNLFLDETNTPLPTAVPLQPQLPAQEMSGFAFLPLGVTAGGEIALKVMIVS